MTTTLDGAWRTLAAAAADRDDAPAGSALAVLADHFGLPVPVGRSLAHGLRSAGIHWIEIRLTDRWHRDGVVPLVAFRNGVPETLLPGRRGYRHADGARVTADEAAGYDARAWQVYPPLAESDRTARGLLRFAARGAGPDARFLLMAGLLAAALAGAMPLLSGWLITRTLDGRADVGVVWWTAALFAGLAVGNVLLLWTRNAALVRLQGRLQLRLEPAVWAHLLGRDVRFLQDLGTGSLVQRANAVGELRRALSNSAASAVLGGAFGLISLGVLMVVDAVVGAAVLTTSVVVLTVAGWAARRQQQHETANREAFGRVSSFLHTALLAIEKVQVAGREEKVFAGWADRYAGQRRTDAAASRWQAVVAAFATALQPATLAALGGSIALLRPDVSLGTFVAASVAVGQFAASAGMLHGAVTSSFLIVSAHRRLRPVLDAPPDVAPGADDPGPLLGRVELHDVTFTYPGTGRPVLDRVDITAEPGEFVAVVGPSGAGKSTLVRVLLGLVPPSSGSVRFDGRDLAELDLRAVRGQVGVVLQQARAVRGSIVDNVVAGVEDVPDERVWEALELAGLAAEVRELPMGLNTMVSEDNAAFSGGQIQRLLLARALVKRPPVLVLDEATSALDNVTQRAVSERIAALSVTRIVVAHRLSTIRAADRVYVLDGGAVAACGSYAELAATSPLFARLVARQEIH